MYRVYIYSFFCVLGLHNIDFICSTCIVSGQSALMHFNKWNSQCRVFVWNQGAVPYRSNLSTL